MINQVLYFVPVQSQNLVYHHYILCPSEARTWFIITIFCARPKPGPDRHKNVSGLIQLIGFQPPFIIESPTTIDININVVQDKYAEFDFIVIAH
jgi:hypothetical protein